MARIHTFAEGDDCSSLNSTFWDTLREAVLPRVATSTSWASWPGEGGLFRLAVMTGLERGGVQTIDNSADWRDRLIATATVHFRPSDWGDAFTGPAYPGNPNDDLTRGAVTLSACACGYTGTGRADGAPIDGYHTIAGLELAVYADSLTGELKVYRDSADPDDPDDGISLMLVILASEQTGERSTPTASPSLAITEGNPIEPHQINGLQDRAMLGQAGEVFGTPTDAFPLGPKLDRGGIPERWLRNLSYAFRDIPRRQPVAGVAWRFFYASAADGAEVVLDTSIDWRDRYVWGSFRWSEDPIGAGGASEADHNLGAFDATNTPAGSRARYMGPGESGTLTPLRGYGLQLVVTASGLQIRARDTDGALVLRNNTGTTKYVTGILAGSFQLGPRTVRS